MNLLLRVGIALVVCTLLLLAVWQYAMPRGLDSPWGLNPLGAEHYRAALGLPRVSLSPSAFRWGFRALLLGAWVGYLLVVWAAHRGAKIRHAWLVSTIAALVLALAVLWPASLSADVYSYVGYARLDVLYGKNPYIETPHALAAFRDPAAPFAPWPIRSPYGPAWTWFSVLLVRSLSGMSLWSQVLAMKLCTASGVPLAAWAAGVLAERLEAGRKRAAFAAVGLNPLFLVEAAGNGHNDLIMVALVLVGLAAFAEAKVIRGSLAVGAAGAVKFVPLVLLPWLVGYVLRERPRRAALTRAAAVGVVGLLPLLVASAHFLGGTSLLSGLLSRWAGARSAPGAPVPLQIGAALTLLLIYAVLSLVALRGPTAQRLLSDWVVVSGTVLVAASGICFPWYLAWPWSALLVRWDRRHMAMSLLLCCAAIAFSFVYTFDVPLPALDHG